MRIIAAQINPTIGDLEGNSQKIIQILQKLSGSVDLVVFPELAICGYPPEDLLLDLEFRKKVPAYLEKISKETKGLIAIIGTIRENLSDGEKPLFNSAAIIDNGRIIGFQDKLLLPTYDVFDERRYFEPGKCMDVWELGNKRIGVTVCEDIWQHAGYVNWTRYAQDPVIELIPKKPDLVVNLSSSPYHFQKIEQRYNVCSKAARSLQCPVLLCCQVGGNDDLVFDGYSLYVDATGKLCKLAKGFEEDLLEIDGNETKKISLPDDPIADLYAALVLGVKDYFGKLGFTRACIGMSGGIDSALTACIVKDALGEENVLGLTMPSRYSSEGSVNDSKILCQNIGIQLDTLPIEPIFTSFLETLKPVFEGTHPNIAEENLQTRIRGTLLMAVSNKHGYILVSTGNKSELGLGYCTLYGDMCGGLNAIGDVLKTQVYALAKWVNRKEEIIPWSIVKKPPSAELRPNQKDTDTIPDYSIVDIVLQAYIEDFLSAGEIAKKYCFEQTVVRKIIRMIHMAEYKRRQAPPVIRISKKAFRTGRRFPIVQKWA